MKVSRKLLSAPVCLAFLIVGIVFGNGMMFLFGNHPWEPLGTISLLCEDRKYLFWVWALFVVGGYYLNTLYAFRRYDERSRALRILSVIAVIAACGIGLSLKHDVTTWNPKRIVHWISTGLYMATLGLTLFLFLMKNAKRYRGFAAMAVTVAAIAAVIVLWLLVFGKSGLMEMIPNTLLEMLLLYLNFIRPLRPKQAQPSPS